MGWRQTLGILKASEDEVMYKAAAEGKNLMSGIEAGNIEERRFTFLLSQLFNTGWVPLLGWTCGFLVLLYYAPQILIITYVWGMDCIVNKVATPFPMQPDDIFNLVWLLFGFGGYSLIKKKMS